LKLNKKKKTPEQREKRNKQSVDWLPPAQTGTQLPATVKREESVPGETPPSTSRYPPGWRNTPTDAVSKPKKKTSFSGDREKRGRHENLPSRTKEGNDYARKNRERVKYHEPITEGGGGTRCPSHK